MQVTWEYVQLSKIVYQVQNFEFLKLFLLYHHYVTIC